MTRRTDIEVLELLCDEDAALNKARHIFSSEFAKIEQAAQQSRSLSPIEMRRIEFEAVEKIFEVLKETGNAGCGSTIIEPWRTEREP
jgi:hypothetical protein